MGARRVRSVDEEDEVLGLCVCGSEWRLKGNAVEPVEGRWHDILRVRCSRCGSAGEFVFDITTFFVPRPGIWPYTRSV
jgi:hypothetical protein